MRSRRVRATGRLGFAHRELQAGLLVPQRQRGLRGRCLSVRIAPHVSRETLAGFGLPVLRSTLRFGSALVV